jgi:hypothetical protein
MKASHREAFVVLDLKQQKRRDVSLFYFLDLERSLERDRKSAAFANLADHMNTTFHLLN